MFEATSTLALFDLTGRTALVTGAGGGLGKAFSRALAEAGAHVICGDIDGEAALRGAAELTGRGLLATAHRVDIADDLSVSDLARAIEADGHEVDILVNNAGIVQDFVRLHELSIESFDRVIDVNLRGAFLCMRAFLPSMVAKRRGSIINISSIVGLRGWAPEHLPQAHYAASKQALVGLTRQAAVEYGKFNVRVNVIAPGLHSNTNLGASSVAKISDAASFLDEAAKMLADHVPLGRWAAPDELRGLLLYLASDASSYMTGQVIAHDGGYTAF